MLVVSRKKNETVKIIVPPSSEPQEIEVMVVTCGLHNVRLGVAAAAEVQILRDDAKCLERRV